MHIMYSHFDIDTLPKKKIYIRIFICVHNSLFAKAATAQYMGFVSSRGLIPIDGYIDWHLAINRNCTWVWHLIW